MEEQATRLRRLKVQAAVKLLAQFFLVCTAGWMPSSVNAWVYLLAGDVYRDQKALTLSWICLPFFTPGP